MTAADPWAACTPAARERRVVLVGEMNHHSSAAEHALYPFPEHCTGGRLCSMLGMTPREYLKTFARVNLLDATPGGRWSPAALVRARAWALLESLRPRTVVMLGARVSAAFEFHPPLENFTEHTTISAELGGLVTTFVRIPHPSARNRVWNETGSVGRLREVMAVLVGDAVFNRWIDKPSETRA